MNSSRSLVPTIFLLSLVLACSGPPWPSPAVPPSPGLEMLPRAGRLVIGVEDEVRGVGPWILGGPSNPGAQTQELYHAWLTTMDDQGVVIPRLAERLPSLDDDSWQVASDGTMRTVYRLRPDVHWHDGAPFTAADVVYGFQTRQEAPGSQDERLSQEILEVSAVDPLTLVIRWQHPRWEAGALREQLLPLPRHRLEFAGATREETLERYWTTDFVGLGPFRVQALVRGSHLELEAFDGYFLGRPAIDSITLRGFLDAATLRSALVTGELDLALSTRWGAVEAEELRVAWEREGHGHVLVYPRAVTLARFRSGDPSATTGLAQPPVRRALAHALNRQQTGFTDSLGTLPAPTAWIPPTDPRWPRFQEVIDDPLTYDPSQAFRLLDEGGWRRSVEGQLERSDHLPLTFELASVRADAMQRTVARYWSEIGILMNLTSLPDVPTDPDWSGVLLQTVPLDFDRIVPLVATGLTSTPFPGTEVAPATGGGTGRGFEARLQQALRPSERMELERQLVQAAMRDVPMVALGFRPAVVPVTAGLTGPRPRFGSQVRPWLSFNAHEWMLTAPASSRTASR